MTSLPERWSHIVVDGKRLETLFYVSTSSGAPTIVMLHEGLGSIALWKDFPARVADTTGCAVLAYSRYGHGKSDHLAEKRPVEFMHHEGQVVLPSLLDQLGIREPILLGHSDGASICILCAGTPAVRPRALILEAPHLFVEDLSIESITKIRTVYQTTDLPQKLGRYHDHVNETFWGWNDIWLDPVFRSWNIEDCLGAIACPTLVIQGENDEYGTLAQVKAIQRRLPNTQTLILPKCGHSPHRDQPKPVLETISDFVHTLR